jgi:hypothetical protein
MFRIAMQPHIEVFKSSHVPSQGLESTGASSSHLRMDERCKAFEVPGLSKFVRMFLGAAGTVARWLLLFFSVFSVFVVVIFLWMRGVEYHCGSARGFLGHLSKKWLPKKL